MLAVLHSRLVYWAAFRLALSVWGSKEAILGILLVPSGIRLAPVGIIGYHFGFLWAPFGILWPPFAVHLITFSPLFNTFAFVSSRFRTLCMFFGGSERNDVDISERFWIWCGGRVRLDQ